MVKIVNSESGPPEFYGVISDIVSISSVFESVCFVWIPREKNSMADKLAKEALLCADLLVVGDALNVTN